MSKYCFIVCAAWFFICGAIAHAQISLAEIKGRLKTRSCPPNPTIILHLTYKQAGCLHNAKMFTPEVNEALECQAEVDLKNEQIDKYNDLIRQCQAALRNGNTNDAGAKTPSGNPGRASPESPASSGNAVQSAAERWSFCKAEKARYDKQCKEKWERNNEAVFQCEQGNSETDCRSSTGAFVPSTDIVPMPFPTATPQPGVPLRERAAARQCTLFSAPCYGTGCSAAQQLREIDESGCTPIPGTELGDQMIRYKAAKSGSSGGSGGASRAPSAGILPFQRSSISFVCPGTDVRCQGKGSIETCWVTRRDGPPVQMQCQQ